MLLVMDTSGRDLFFSPSGHPTTMWGVTWGKIDTFMPGLREELFPGWEKRAEQAAAKQQQPPAPCESDPTPSARISATISAPVPAAAPPPSTAPSDAAPATSAPVPT